MHGCWAVRRSAYTVDRFGTRQARSAFHHERSPAFRSGTAPDVGSGSRVSTVTAPSTGWCSRTKSRDLKLDAQCRIATEVIDTAAPAPGTKTPSCRECGAPHDGQSATCAFCRAPLATLRCAHCFHSNFTDTDHCAACGEHLGLEPVPLAQSHACPVCSEVMTVFEDETAGLWDCGRCSGQFVAHPLLQSLLTGRRQWRRSQVPKPTPLSLEQTVRYRRCPVCSEWMHRRNFGGTSGVVVDVCAAHGVWFDTWELQQVLNFVEAGGLADLRRASLGLPPAKTKDEQERGARAVAHALMQAKASQSTPSGGTSLTVATLTLLWELLDFWARLVK